jgi:hypothetical protein
MPCVITPARTTRPVVVARRYAWPVAPRARREDRHRPPAHRGAGDERTPELAARILRVWDMARQAHLAAERRQHGTLIVRLRNAWASLLNDPDEIDLAAARSAVEEAERLVGEGR